MGKLQIITLLLCCFALSALCSVPSADNGTQVLTSDRVAAEDWWPTKGAAPRNQYVGTAACARCHAEKVKTQSATPMALTQMRATTSQELHSSPEFSFQQGSYNYRIRHAGKQVFYSVHKGAASLSFPLEFAFGSGVEGQSYLYSRGGKFYEARVSYFASLHGLDLTPGQPRAEPAQLEAAQGRHVEQREVKLCFSCHNTAATTSYDFDASRAVPGVTCEACHGPGGRHVVAMNLDPNDTGPKFIFNPATLPAVDSVEFCGACHRSRSDVVVSGNIGPQDVRFHVYRLETSKCFGNGDSRLTCIGCHDPHKELVRDAASYDKQCTSCHATKAAAATPSGRTASACPVQDKDCVSCHMPKVEVPEIHSTFTDHRIRIVRAGAPFPE
jgi:Cytochrome c554 and c-prime